MPPAAPHRVVIVVPPQPQLLDVVGPAEVFQTAALLGGPAYEIETVGLTAPSVTAAGLTLTASTTARRLRRDVRRIDTLVVAGGLGARQGSEDRAAVRTVAALAAKADRVTSVCTGAFLLAAAGLLDHRRAVTHWAYCAELARRFPLVEVEPAPVFVHDGDLWTSGGVTAGMDLALALVSDDHDAGLAHEVARWLVMFSRRPGGQAQFSSHLAVPAPRSPGLGDVLGWAADHLADDLSVEALARRAAMSPRTFARRFSDELGTSPGAWVQALRVEAAQQALQQSDDTVATVARRCGFGDPSALHRAFRAQVGTTPASYRDHFRTTDQQSPPAARAS